MRVSVALIVLCLASACAVRLSAQTPSATPAGAQDVRQMSREERIRAHQAKIDKIIQENRRKQEEEQRKVLEAQKAQQPGAPPDPNAPVQPGAPPPGQPGAPAPGGPGGPGAPAPGQPLPTGPVVPMGAQAPGVPGRPAAPAAAPSGARSEARSFVFFRPFDSVVNVGETFSTEIAVDTRNGSTDEMRFLVSYPVGVLNPLAADVSPADDYLGDEEVEYSCDNEEGLLYLRMRLKESRKFVGQPVAKIVWEALAPTTSVNVNFEFGEEKTTALMLDGTNILGTSPGSQDGVINTTVLVRLPKSRPVVMKMNDGGVVVATSRYEPPKPGMRLELVPEKSEVGAGEEFRVDIHLRNDNRDPIDRVQLLVEYDPSLLEVVDSDRGNWIREGINMHDGPAHAEFPFDYHRINAADNKAGRLAYDVAAESTAVRGTGLLGSVVFRALKPAESVAVRLTSAADNRRITTQVSYLNATTLVDYPDKGGTVAEVRLVAGPGGPSSGRAGGKVAVRPGQPRHGMKRNIQLR